MEWMEKEREKGQSAEKGAGWEVYKCNGPVATPSIFSDMTAETQRWENTDVTVISQLGEDGYMTLNKFISPAGPSLKEHLEVLHQVTIPNTAEGHCCSTVGIYVEVILTACSLYKSEISFG